MRISAKTAKALGLTVPPRKRGKLATMPPKLRGERKEAIYLTGLPFPPTVNHYYTVAHGRKILSKAGRDYRKAFEYACTENISGHVVGEVAVEIWAWPPDKRRRDLDNLLKACLDALTFSGVYEDDSQIRKLTIHRCIYYPPVGTLTIEVLGETYESD